MKSEYPYSPLTGKKDELTAPPPSRFVDERLSGESDTAGEGKYRSAACRFEQSLLELS